MEESSSDKSNTQGLIHVQNEVVFIESTVPTWISHVSPVPENIRVKNVVVLILPGYPGLAGFYEEFMVHLWERSDRSMEIYCVSYPGHGSLRNLQFDKPVNAIELSEKCPQFSLSELSGLMASFLRERFSAETRFIVIGHSTGAYISLEIFQKSEEAKRIVKAFLLFPAVERIPDTPAGKRDIAFMEYYGWILPVIRWLCYYMPEWIMSIWVRHVLRLRGYACTPSRAQTLRSFLSHVGIASVFISAKEMISLKELRHTDVIAKNIDKLTFYYSPDDYYAPKSYHDDMKKRFPTADIRLCSGGHKHAFNITSPGEMSFIVWDWCRKTLDAHK